MLLLLLLLQIVVIMIRYNTTIPSLSCTYKALISTTKSTMSIYLTSAPLEAFPPSSTKPTLFFSRASPPNNFRACAAGSPAPQAEKFSLPVHLWVKCKQNSESITLLTIFLTRVFGVFGVYHGISRRSSLVAPGSLLPRRQNAHKKYCAAHSVLF